MILQLSCVPTAPDVTGNVTDLERVGAVATEEWPGDKVIVDGCRQQG